MNYIVVYYMGLGTILDVSMCVVTDLFNLHILGHRDMANLLKSPFFFSFHAQGQIEAHN